MKGKDAQSAHLQKMTLEVDHQREEELRWKVPDKLEEGHEKRDEGHQEEQQLDQKHHHHHQQNLLLHL
jgi:hypothetical protein